MNNSGLQKLRESGHDDVADIIAEGNKCWDDRLMRCRLSVAENYLKGEIGFHAHIKARVLGDSTPAGEYCIRFRVVDGGSNEVGVSGIIPRPVSSDADGGNTMRHRSGSTDSQSLMLVNAVEFVNPPERIEHVIVPSLVWLNRLDVVTSSRLDTPDLLPLNLCTHWLGMTDGELRTPHLCRGNSSRMFARKSQSQMVQCGAEVEDAIANKETYEWRNRACATDSEPPWADDAVGNRLWRGFWIWLVNESVGFCLAPSIDLVVEALEMRACPL